MTAEGTCAKCGRVTTEYDQEALEWSCKPFCGIKYVSVTRAYHSGSISQPAPHLINVAPLGDAGNPNVRKRRRKARK